MNNERCTRFLIESDYQLVNAALTKNPKLWRGQADSKYLDEVMNLIPLYLSGQGGRKLIGSFEGDELIAILGIYIWKNKPYWTLTNLRTFGSKGKLNFKSTGITDCINMAFAYTLKLGLHKFYFFWPTRKTTNKPYKKNIIERHMYEGEMYYKIVEATIPANKLPEIPWQKAIMGNRTYPFETVIVSANLKPHLYEKYGIHSEVEKGTN